VVFADEIPARAALENTILTKRLCTGYAVLYRVQAGFSTADIAFHEM